MRERVRKEGERKGERARECKRDPLSLSLFID
jgi:hypothetical protein